MLYNTVRVSAGPFDRESATIFRGFHTRVSLRCFLHSSFDRLRNIRRPFSKSYAHTLCTANERADLFVSQRRPDVVTYHSTFLIPFKTKVRVQEKLIPKLNNYKHFQYVHTLSASRDNRWHLDVQMDILFVFFFIIFHLRIIFVSINYQVLLNI